MVQATPSTEAPPAAAADAVFQSLMGALRVLKRATAGLPVDGPGLFVLQSIGSKGPLRPTDLASDLGLDASTVSRHLQALERLALVERNRDPDDGRAFRVACTESGCSTLDEAATARRSVISAALQGWNAPDTAQLVSLLGRLADDLVARAEQPAPTETTRPTEGEPS